MRKITVDIILDIFVGSNINNKIVIRVFDFVSEQHILLSHY